MSEEKKRNKNNGNWNGVFAVFSPVSENPIATHESSQFDNEPWYTEILGLIYEP